jgi:hypothetical protein
MQSFKENQKSATKLLVTSRPATKASQLSLTVAKALNHQPPSFEPPGRNKPASSCHGPSEALHFGMFTPANLLGSIIFGSIGFVAFIYGKKLSKIPPLLLGMVLMAYPYFISETWLLYGVGALLTAGLAIWKEE